MTEPTGPSRLPSSRLPEGAPSSVVTAGEREEDGGFRAMLDATSQLMWLVEPDGTLVEANRAALEFGGLRREDVVGQDFWSSPWWEGSEEAQARLQKAARQAGRGVPVRYEIAVQGAVERVATLDLSIRPIRDGAEPALLFVEGHLLTATVQARQMQESLIAAQVGTWEIDLGTDAVRRSTSCDLIFGFEPDDRPRPLSDYLACIHPADRARAQDAVLRATEEQGEHFMEFRVIRADGAERWTAVRGTSILDEHGEPARLVGAILDVTEQHATEAALRTSEERFRHLVLSLPAAVYTTDREGHVTLFNEQAAELWGRRPEIGKDQWCGSWRIYRPDGTPLPFDECPMAVALREERSVRDQEIIVERPDGTRAHVLPYPEPLRDASGAVVGAVNMLVDITERKRADRDQALLAAIVESSDDAIVSLSLDAVITSWNEGAERILGYTAEEAISQSVLMLIPPERHDEETLILNRIRRGERTKSFETVRLTKDGRALDVALTISPIRGSDGRIIGASRILRDITERKRAEARTHFLAETGLLVEQALDYEATLQQIAHLAVPGFADWCAVDLLHDDGSIAAIAIAHADPEKVQWGWELREREPVDPDAPTGTPHVIRTGQSELYAHIPDELLVASARDEEHLQLMREIGFSSVIIVPMRAGSTAVGALTFVNTESGRRFDEADLAAAEELGRRAGAALDVARLHTALRESEARFRHLAEALPDIAYTLPGDRPAAHGDTEYLSPQWYAYTGLREGTSYAEAVPEVIHPDDIARVRETWAKAAAAAKPVELEIRLRRHDGAYRWFLTRIVPVLDADGHVVRWFGTSADIHSQKATEAELAERVAERTAELARSNEELDQFAYVASHDLKAPLRGIDNLASWIAEDAGPLLPEASKRHLDLLQGRIRRMEQLLSDLLAYSRTGREEGAPEAVDVAALVHEVADLLDGPPEIEVVVGGEMPTLVTPRAPLEMIFRNLLGNVFKHHDQPKGRVRVSARDTGDFVTFTVEDDGPGIPVRYHERIFGLFQTLRPRDEVEGSGMGLAVVKKAVESRGGVIRVDSAEGRGAAFTFTWPRHV